MGTVQGRRPKRRTRGYQPATVAAPFNRSILGTKGGARTNAWAGAARRWQRVTRPVCRWLAMANPSRWRAPSDGHSNVDDNLQSALRQGAQLAVLPESSGAFALNRASFSYVCLSRIYNQATSFCAPQAGRVLHSGAVRRPSQFGVSRSETASNKKAHTPHPVDDLRHKLDVPMLKARAFH